MLRFVDPRLDRLQRVLVANLDRRLRHDRPAVERVVD